MVFAHELVYCDHVGQTKIEFMFEVDCTSLSYFAFLVPCTHPQVGSEEVTVPFVLSRIFCEILPCLEDVLTQRCGPAASAAGFRCSAIIHG